MNTPHCPVVLVHGWNSHPGIWNRLVPRLKKSGIPVWNFDHSGLKDEAPERTAASLQEYLMGMREDGAYQGPLDLVCHSMGTGVARYLVEVLDREGKTGPVRQLIGIGPPNNGSALAELFSDPDHGPEIIRALEGIFVPKGFVPEDDVIVQAFRPGSRTMRRLRDAGTRDDITYRVLVAANHSQNPAFFPWFSGKTWERGDDGRWQTTYAGDGIVAHSDSQLPGINLDIIIAESGNGHRPDQYCHIHLPRGDGVVQKILEYLLS